MDFKPGAVCRIVDSKCLSRLDKHLVGRECTVLLQLDPMILHPHVHSYEVEIPNVGRRLLCYSCLEPALGWSLSGWLQKMNSLNAPEHAT